jgi:multicomponent K+:H+ antiporter subunit E
MMRQIAVFAVLFVFWLALNQSVSPGQIVLGAAIAVVVPRAVARFGLARAATLRRPLLMLKLIGRVAVDIGVANLALAKRVLGPEARLRSHFVWMPLAIRSPHGIAVLATMISLTPGTVSAALSADGRHLLIHVFDMPDEAALVASIRDRYEAPLREIFGC